MKICGHHLFDEKTPFVTFIKVEEIMLYQILLPKLRLKSCVRLNYNNNIIIYTNH